MNDELLKALRQVRNSNIDLFSEYCCLALDFQRKGDTDTYKYWTRRAVDISRENRKIESDIYKITEGKYVV